MDTHMLTHKHTYMLTPCMSMLFQWRDRTGYLIAVAVESEQAVGYDPFICMLIREPIEAWESRKISS